MLKKLFPPATGARLTWATITKIAGAIVAAVIVGFLIYRLFFLPDQLRKETAEAKQESRAAVGSAELAEDVLGHVESRSEYREIIRETVTNNEQQILDAPGADDPISPDVHDAGVAAVRRLREQTDQRQRQGAELP